MNNMATRQIRDVWVFAFGATGVLFYLAALTICTVPREESPIIFTSMVFFTALMSHWSAS